MTNFVQGAIFGAFVILAIVWIRRRLEAKRILRQNDAEFRRQIRSYESEGEFGPLPAPTPRVGYPPLTKQVPPPPPPQPKSVDFS